MNEVVKSKYKYELAVCYPVSDASVREKDMEILESLEHGSIIFWQNIWDELGLSKVIKREVSLTSSKSFKKFRRKKKRDLAIWHLQSICWNGR